MKKEGGSYVWNESNLFITDEVGVGKTFEAGIILKELLKNNPEASVLIICPVKLCTSWEQELRENFYLSFNNFKATKSSGQLNIVPYSYFNSMDLKSLEEETDGKVDELKYQEDEGITIEEMLNNSIHPLEYDILILDEAHYIRNKQKLWKCIESLIKRNEKDTSKLKIFMTATPIFNSETDYEHITELLEDFETTTTLQGEANCYDFILDIKCENVRLNEEEQEIINSELVKGFTKRLATSSINSLIEFVEAREKFDQQDIDPNETLEDISGYFKHPATDSKLAALNNLLDKIKNEAPEGKFKVIIFSSFLSTCSYLERELSSTYKVYKITGKDDYIKVQQMKVNFEKEKEDAILICSDAAKEGHNLQYCQHLIHYDFPYTPAALGQRNGRIYRRGQEGKPKVYYMHVENSYDERLFGEVIVSKSHIIKGFSDNDQISILNVLPNDSEQYVNTCLRKYFFEKVETSGTAKKAFNSILAKRFSKQYNGIKEWTLPLYKNLYESNVELSDEQYCNKFIELFGGSYAVRTDELLQYYQQQYKKYFLEVLNNIFNLNETQLEDVESRFIQLCIEYTKKYGNLYINEKKQLFCHDLLQQDVEVNENGRLSISAYKQQFKPLKQLNEMFCCHS